MKNVITINPAERGSKKIRIPNVDMKKGIVVARSNCGMDVRVFRIAPSSEESPHMPQRSDREEERSLP